MEGTCGGPPVRAIIMEKGRKGMAHGKPFPATMKAMLEQCLQAPGMKEALRKQKISPAKWVRDQMAFFRSKGITIEHFRAQFEWEEAHKSVIMERRALIRWLEEQRGDGDAAILSDHV